MLLYKVVESYDGRLPIYNVVDTTSDKILKSFDTYEEADIMCNTLINESTTAPCGEEIP